MALTQEKKSELFKKHGRHDKDTGSPEAQVAVLTQRIKELTEHLKDNPKDFACRRGLMLLVGRRQRLQNYYRSQCTPEAYQAFIKKLKLRK